MPCNRSRRRKPPLVPRAARHAAGIIDSRRTSAGPYSYRMGNPFTVEVDVGGASTVAYTIDEETLRKHRSVQVQAAMAQHGPEDTDERVRLLRGALEIVRAMIEKNADVPIKIFNGPDVWVIPIHAVRAVRVHDPDAPMTGRSIGFMSRGD